MPSGLGPSSYTTLFIHPIRRHGPKGIFKIGSDVKKEWKTKNMDARSERKKKGNQASHNTGKRKMSIAEDASYDDMSSETKRKTKKPKGNDSTAKSTNVSTSSKSNGTSATTDSENNAVKIAASLAKATDQPEKKLRTKQTARCTGRGGASNVSLRKVEDKADTAEKPPRKKQTARRGGIKVAPRTTSLDKPNTPQNKPRKKQTARRGGGFFGGKHETVTTRDKSYHSFNDNELDGYIEMENTHDLNESEPGGYSNPVSASSQRLGLINGVYEIRSDALDQWSEFPQEEFTLILCLSGNSVWGAYDFGMYHGILYMPDRPYSASQDMVPFTWRGRERGEGEMSFDEDNEGYMRFLGDGKIEGEINCYGQAKFIGSRTSGNNTRLPRSVASMQHEWNGYNSHEYERERVARWH
ncbi:hypothetical protein POJ06DRAFT_282784 [Lipomyces tetrasporus]|uniref:Uncharacterized protein n=1 Tax=Lipomyces tetrasporus TaxID=54092 RepID=A0AAD7QP66_9ASCO|nr:uncharacterized protein POJ06DRAFT_282784 [Lipomyces tetrasporus]KAJ8098915.1 hypothetical protein POJ06DRAFT_282784 [Lipomyces tetrasporus]